MSSAPRVDPSTSHDDERLDLDPREDETLRNLLLSSDTFARLVDDLPTGDTRELLIKWGEIRGLYPESATQAPGGRALRHAFDLQPVGRPEPVAVSLDQDEVYETFYALLIAVQAWQEPEELGKGPTAYRHLIQLTEALTIMTRAYLTSRAPVERALDADKEAARAWRLNRWFSRSRLTPPASSPSEAPTPQEKGAQE